MQITNQLIEELLWSDEGTALDFKGIQYPFAGASDVAKSELLKDVLAFANAFRQQDAFILVGVQEIKGGRSLIVGVAGHLEDAHLQQFINSKTQRHINFAYRTAEIDGKQIGIIHIPKQKRPFYAKSTFGNVIQGKVYVRHGSSTAIAEADEVAAMGADQLAARAGEPALEVLLWDREKNVSLGTSRALACIALSCPAEDDIPDYHEGFSPMEAAVLRPNVHFYREAAEYVRVKFLVQKVALAIRNSGEVTAEDVRLVMEVSDPAHMFTFMEEREIPGEPKRRNDLMPDMKNFRRVGDPDPTVSIERTADVWRIECRFGKIQPKGTARLPDDLYVGANESMDLDLEMRISADNLSQPTMSSCVLHIAAESHQMTTADITNMNFKRFIEARTALATKNPPE